MIDERATIFKNKIFQSEGFSQVTVRNEGFSDARIIVHILVHSSTYCFTEFYSSERGFMFEFFW